MLKDIEFPEDLKYSSDRERKPLEFYLKSLRNSTSLDLRLGYFSSNAIRTLSLGFAQFLYRKGKVRIVTNHYLSKKDKELLNPKDSGEYDYDYIEPIVDNDVKGLADILNGTEQHFFNCLKYLIKKDRLIIKPVKVKPDKLSHYKEGIFSDGKNQVYFNGSCNFTYSGIIENGEGIDIKRSWGYEPERKSIKNEKVYLEKIFNEKDDSLVYLNPDQITSVVKKKGLDKDLEELVKDEINIYDSIRNYEEIKNIVKEEEEKFRLFIKQELNKPKFPYPTGPYDYQVKAYKEWVDNGYKGIFAMATGTGKTITSLNCLLNEYNDKGSYKALILVPTIALVEQWKKEIKNFNFAKIYEVSGNSNWREHLIRLKNAFLWGESPDYVIVSTYASFQNEDFLSLMDNFPKETFLIADEAHNIGATNTQEAIRKINFNKKVALSATPKRAYDPKGNEVIESIFNDSPPYCFSYSMEKAIDNNVLSRYYYYPKIVSLEEDELEEYQEITSRLVKFFGKDSEDFFENDIVTSLLIKRKNVIHKARNKLNAFRQIAIELDKEDKLKYCFVYVPEGYRYSSSGKEAYYIIMMNILAEVNSKIRQSSFLGGDPDRDSKLRGFREGRIDALVAMKCLDEGVDVPRAEIGIFASSTGNPRQFIQRRGRLLRTHDDKKHSQIYDLVVTPNIYSLDNDNETYDLERSLFKKELTRVAYFASLSENFHYSKETFKELSDYFNVNLDSIIRELKEDDT